VCAERVAFFKAISEGEKHFIAIAVAGGPADETAKADFPPCGVCRQVMAEFCDKDFIVIWGNSEKITKKTLGEILPFGFDKTNL
jgi:cytidine deaminase